MNKKAISIFFPVYNEERSIDAVLSETSRVMESLTDDYEILIINDGSTDRSGEIVSRWMKDNDRIKLINHEGNLGYGTALRTGFKNAEKDLVLYTDSDMPVSLDEIRNLVVAIDGYDLAIGYRINREDTLRRFIYSKIYNFLLRVLLGVKVRDANFSFKCIKKAAVQKCNLKAKSVFIDGELLAEAVRNGLTVKEVPIIYRPRKHGSSNFDSFIAAISTLKELVFYWKDRHLSIRGGRS